MSEYSQKDAIEEAVERFDAHVTDLRNEILILKQALKEAGDFAMKRLPHDARERAVSSEYFQTMFMACALETIKGERSEKPISEPDHSSGDGDTGSVGTAS